EFADSSSWGPNAAKTDELLAGRRAGAMQERERLRKLMKESGADSVLAASGEDQVNITTPAGHTDKWLTGYNEGIATIRARVRQFHDQHGLVAIEDALKKPIDSSEVK